ncbi:MAG TPA: AbrB/MazE/SpoVT family DNA-binding domain-containing protein [Thermoanaerobaculia bacterium]|nr:AbrB/MazE/SpoVT family DNA-binding domain-containing protein [Thermoanaerobaculia bacterium]
MSRSTLTAKYQTTVPREVREKLGAKPGDVLQWEVVGSSVRVSAAIPAFLTLQGSFKVGPGDPVDDVRKVRELMGREGR